MGVLFYLLLSDQQNRESFFNYITTVNYFYLLIALILFMVAVITNAIKWQILLKAQGIQVPLTALTNYTFVGFFFNNFLPANVGGDVMRGFGLARYTERSAEAAVSVIVDRIIGLMAFMFTAVVAALLAANFIINDPEVEQILQIVEILAIAGMAAMIIGFSVILSHRLRDWVGQTLFAFSFLKPFEGIYQHLSQAFGAYRHQYRSLWSAFLIGVITVLLTGLVDIAIVAGLQGEIAPIYIFLFNPIIAILLIAPISIGGLGTGSALYVGFYAFVGVPQPLSFALSLFKQIVIYLGSLPGGVLWLFNRGQRRNDSTMDSSLGEKSEAV